MSERKGVYTCYEWPCSMAEIKACHHRRSWRNGDNSTHVQHAFSSKAFIALVTVEVVKNKNRDSLESFTPPHTWPISAWSWNACCIVGYKKIGFFQFLLWKGMRGGYLRCCSSIQQRLEAYWPLYCFSFHSLILHKTHTACMMGQPWMRNDWPVTGMHWIFFCHGGHCFPKAIHKCTSVSSVLHLLSRVVTIISSTFSIFCSSLAPPRGCYVLSYACSHLDALILQTPYPSTWKIDFTEVQASWKVVTKKNEWEGGRKAESTQTWHMTSVESAESHSKVIVQRSDMT